MPIPARLLVAACALLGLAARSAAHADVHCEDWMRLCPSHYVRPGTHPTRDGGLATDTTVSTVMPGDLDADGDVDEVLNVTHTFPMGTESVCVAALRQPQGWRLSVLFYAECLSTVAVAGRAYVLIGQAGGRAGSDPQQVDEGWYELLRVASDGTPRTVWRGRSRSSRDRGLNFAAAPNDTITARDGEGWTLTLRWNGSEFTAGPWERPRRR
jgi:hypothetical protein